jgi:hypothetical protein
VFEGKQMFFFGCQPSELMRNVAGAVLA